MCRLGKCQGVSIDSWYQCERKKSDHWQLFPLCSSYLDPLASDLWSVFGQRVDKTLSFPDYLVKVGGMNVPCTFVGRYRLLKPCLIGWIDNKCCHPVCRCWSLSDHWNIGLVWEIVVKKKTHNGRKTFIRFRRRYLWHGSSNICVQRS